MKKYITFLQLWCTCLALILTGCYDSIDNGGGGVIVHPNEIELPIPLQLPVNQNVLTRSMDATDENHVETMDVLLFRVNSDQTETYAYNYHATNIQNFGENPEKLMVVRLKKSTQGEAYRIVMLANLRSEVTTALATVSEGDPKAEVLEKIRLTQEGKWPTDDGTNPSRNIPMWGESAQAAVVSGTTTASSFGGTIYLLRALARINISIHLHWVDENNPADPAPDATDYFRIESVKLHNTRKQSYATPLAGNYEVTAGRPKATRPSILNVANNLNDPDTMIYEDEFINNALINEIYVSELLNSTAQEPAPADVFFLVFKAFYKDPKNPDAVFDQPTWYRVDLYDKNATEPNTHMDILRNHSYNVVITDVQGPGYPTEPEAENSVPINIDSEVLEWDNGDEKEIVFDGYYVLAVNRSLFRLNRQKYDADSPDEDNLLKVYTNYTYYDANRQPTHGWYIEQQPADFPAWLKPDKYQGMPNDTTDVKLLLDENITGQEREFKFRIVAGRLHYQITVIQGIDSHLQLTVMNVDGSIYTGHTGNELGFFSGQGVKTAVIPNSLIVTWSPQTLPCDVSVVQTTGADGDFVSHILPSEQIVPGQLQNGQKIYIVYPPSMTETELDTKIDLVKSSDITFKVTDGTEEESVTVTLHQKNYAVWTEGLKDYYRTGKQHLMDAKANVPWIATTNAQLDPNAIFDGTSWSSGGNGNNFAREDLRFPIKKDRTIDGLKGEILISSTDPMKPFEDITVEVMAAHPGPNCYVIAPNSTGSIVLRKPYIVFQDYDFLTELSEQSVQAAKVVWTDQPNLIQSVEVISDPDLASSSEIRVTTSGSTGNAVVALTLDGDIRWSWHVWVTDYNPDNTNYTYNNGYATHTFMDRNLGAKANLYTGNPQMPDISQTLGLYYQWGRKDPFPPSDSPWGGNQHQTVYEGGGSAGSRVSMRDPTISDNANNLLLTIENPATYYLTSWGDWYTRYEANKNNYLWSDEEGDKAYCDPCPEGWRTPKMTGRVSVWYSPSADKSWNPADYGNPAWVSGWNFTASSYPHGYYPAAGYWGANIVPPADIFTGLDIFGYCWVGEVPVDGDNDSEVMSFTMMQGGVWPGNLDTLSGYGFSRGCATSVRCVKE